jgi:hypothetical protein
MDKTKLKIFFLGGIMLVFLGVITSGCITQSSPSIINTNFVRMDSTSTRVDIDVQNVGSDTIHGAWEVTARMYDKEGEFICKASYTQFSLEPKEKIHRQLWCYGNFENREIGKTEVVIEKLPDAPLPSSYYS